MPKKHYAVSLLLCLLALVAIPSAAQSAPRAVPSNNNYLQATDVFLSMNPAAPAVFSVADMDEADLEIGELLHTCGPDNNFTSVWYEFSTVPGKLVIDTAGSNIDTIMTLYYKPVIAQLPYLDAIACADLGTGGSQQARMSVNVPADRFILQVTHNDPTKPADAAVSISFSFDPKSDAKAPGDNFAKAKPVKLGKRFTISNVAYATTEAGETNPTCATFYPIRHTVWYTFTTPLAGELTANLFGSALEGPVNELILAVYREDTPGVLTEIACDSGSAGIDTPPFVDGQVISPGKHYLQIGVSTSLNLLPDSRYLLSAGIDLVPTTLQSGNFDGDNSKWKIGGGATGSAIELEPPGSSLTDNVFACRNPGASNPSLTQKVNLGGLTFKSEMQFLLQISMASNAADHYRVKAQITVKYSNGTSAKVVRSLYVYVNSGASGGVSLPIKPGNIVSASLKILCAPPAGQTLYLDNLALSLRAMTPYRDAQGVLPLPLPPVGQ